MNDKDYRLNISYSISHTSLVIPNAPSSMHNSHLNCPLKHMWQGKVREMHICRVHLETDMASSGEACT